MFSVQMSHVSGAHVTRTHSGQAHNGLCGSRTMQLSTYGWPSIVTSKVPLVSNANRSYVVLPRGDASI